MQMTHKIVNKTNNAIKHVITISSVINWEDRKEKAHYFQDVVKGWIIAFCGLEAVKKMPNIEQCLLYEI